MIGMETEFNAETFRNVALLMGGWSAEREISLKSGEAVYRALLSMGVNVCAIDVDKNFQDVLKEGEFDCAVNIVHGRGGEDGVIQSVLELLEIPYTGTGVLGSALSMDKVRTKQIWRGVGLNTPDFVILNTAKDCVHAIEVLGLPVIVKPTLEGSSIGISKVETASQMVTAWEEASQYGPVMAEQWVDGGEYTVSILKDTALPTIRIETPRTFYDYQAKYFDESTQYFCPSGLDDVLEDRCKLIALEAFRSIDGFGWGRVDFMVDHKGSPWLIDVNTVPGMTDHSLVPMAAEKAGIDFEELCMKVLSTAVVRCHAI